MKRIYIEITNLCNLSCSFCPKTKRKPKIMSCEEFEQILQKTAHITKFIYLHIMGEPLCHPNFPQILSLCDKYNIELNITTNATLIKQNLDFLLNNTSLRKISFSIHSSDQNKEKVFDENYLKECIFAAKELAKVNKISQFRLWNSDVADNKEMLKSIYEEFDNISIEGKLGNYKLGNHIFLNIKESFKWPSLNEDILQTNGYCLGLKQQLGILSDGTVVPCCLDSEGDIPLGNIFLEDIDDILNKERTNAMKQGFNRRILTEELCKRCGYSEKNFKHKMLNKKGIKLKED